MNDNDEFMTSDEVLASIQKGKDTLSITVPVRSADGFRWPCAARHIAQRRGVGAAADWLLSQVNETARASLSRADAEREVRSMFYNPARLPR